MTVETFNTKQAITVTRVAAEHFAKTLSKKGCRAVRISLKESGCTGYKYEIDDVKESKEGDISIVLENGILIYLDPKHLAALSGTTIDYVEQGLNKNLVLNNPNVKDMCGCGESFSV